MAIDIQQKVNTTIFDYDLFGGTDASGQVKQLWGTDALKNSILLWMSSMHADFVRDPMKGGTLVAFVTKPMTETNYQSMVRAISSALDEEFKPKLTNVTVNVSPNYEKRFWTITITAFCPDLKESVQVTSRIKNQA
jgi:hypothetical protein